MAPPPSPAALELVKMVDTLLNPPTPAYRYEDFLADLKNPSVSIDTVLARCGGKIPQEWELRLTPAPASVAEPGPIEFPAMFEDRGRARLEWFQKASVNTRLLKVVAPPPPPPAVPSVKAWVIHCKWCVNTQPVAYTSPPMSYEGRRRVNLCEKCGGKGLVMITGG